MCHCLLCSYKQKPVIIYCLERIQYIICIINIIYKWLDHLEADKKGADEEAEEKVAMSENNSEFICKKLIEEYDFMSLVMYPALKNRREFIHDCWLIAKDTENTELKMAITHDPYFYLTRDDLLKLLQTYDDKMITHILEKECMLLI